MKRILSFSKRENTSVAILQEAHFTEKEQKKSLNTDWIGHVYFSSFNNKSGDVALLIHPNLQILINHLDAD